MRLRLVMLFLEFIITLRLNLNVATALADTSVCALKSITCSNILSIVPANCRYASNDLTLILLIYEFFFDNLLGQMGGGVL